MQERILTGIPFCPAVLPVRPSVIAGILAKDCYWRWCAGRGSRVKNELRAALRTVGSTLHDDFFLLFRKAHEKAGLKTKSRKAIAKELGRAPALRSPAAVEATLRPAMEPCEMDASDEIDMCKGPRFRRICIIGMIFAGSAGRSQKLRVFGMATARVPRANSKRKLRLGGKAGGRRP